MKPGQRGKVAGGSQRRERRDSVTRQFYIAAWIRKARSSNSVHKESSVQWLVMSEGEVELTRPRLSISLGRRIFGRGDFEIGVTTHAW